MASGIVRVPSNSIIGLKREATTGTPVVSNNNTDATAYNRLNVAEASAPVFNIIRESRMTSGAGSVKNLDDTFTSNAGGTVEVEFECPVTPKLLPFFLSGVMQNGAVANTNEYTYDVTKTSRNSVPLGVAGTTVADAHTFTLAYLENQAELSGTGIKLSGCMIRELTLSWQAGSNGNNLMMSGVIMTGVSVGTTGFTNRASTYTPSNWVDPTLAYYNGSELTTKTLDVGAEDTQDLVINAFSVTINNNAQRYGADSRGDAEGYMVPEYSVTGSLSVKSDDKSHFVASGLLDDFIGGEKSTLNLRWGSSFVGDGDLQITGEVQYSGQPDLQLDDAIFVNLPFEFGTDGSTTEALRVNMFSSSVIGTW